MNEFLMRILIFAMDIKEVFRLKKPGGGLVHIQDIADDGLAGHLLCVLVFFLLEHIENIKHDGFPFLLGKITA